jgi:hypothetical protein
MENKLTGYELSRNFFDWAFENPEKINPNHTAIYFFAIEHCNRLGWKTKFGFPSQMTMEALGIKKHQTYIKYFNDLVEWGFFILVEKSRNQYSANIISINNAMLKNGKALDKANIKHVAKQTESNGQSNGSIDKQETIEQINNIASFDFKIPSLEYCIELFKNKTAFNWTEDYAVKSANTFYYFYESKNWMVGKNKMKSLNAAIGGWISRDTKPELSATKTQEQINKEKLDYCKSQGFQL